MASSKITKVHGEHREWKSPNGGSIYYRTIELENGDVGSIGTKEVQPDWLQEHKILEYTLDKAKGKITKSKPDFKGGGGFKKKDNTKTWASISAMLKLNALECSVETESYNESISRNDAINEYLKFLCDLPPEYRNGVDKWGVENEHLIVRMAVTKRVAQLFKVDKSLKLEDIVTKCNNYLKWTSTPL